jgi:putative ABC transport system permease protein
VSLEVGLSTLCLMAGGLLLHSFVKVLGVDRGFSAERAASVQLSVTHARYQEAATRVAFMDRLLERVRSLQGVRSAGSASRLPLSGQAGGVLLSVDGTNLPRLERPIVAMAVTDPGYFQTIGIPLQAGRIFDEADRNRRLVAVVAESVAERVWPGQNPVGQRFRLGPDQAPLVEVVGVVGNVRGVSLIERPTLHVYLPYWQSETSLYSDQVSLVIRTATNMPEAFSAIRTAIRQIAPKPPRRSAAGASIAGAPVLS